jgi:hypothetical protein
LLNSLTGAAPLAVARAVTSPSWSSWR